MSRPNRFRTIADYHRFAGLPPPDHPLLSVIDYGQVEYQIEGEAVSWVQDFYSVGLKRDVDARLWYGRQEYDFEGGLMAFIAPGRVVSLRLIASDASRKPSGYLLLLHPELFYGTQLASRIGAYEMFHYALTEALFLSPREETVIEELLQNIAREYRAVIDRFSQRIIVTQVEQLLSYAERFYARQFVTRQAAGHRVIARLEEVLREACQPDRLEVDGPPRVSDLARAVHLSPNYLATLLRELTGRSTQQHIQAHLVERGKELLVTTDESVSGIAYRLGFRHAASFSKLFRRETAVTPTAYREGARLR